jgi:hypothetical protein
MQRRELISPGRLNVDWFWRCSCHDQRLSFSDFSKGITNTEDHRKEDCYKMIRRDGMMPLEKE